jgi:hypothetical protein
VLSSRIRPEIIGKNPGNSRLKYCFHVPDTSRVHLQDPMTFLRDPVAETIALGRRFNMIFNFWMSSLFSI